MTMRIRSGENRIEQVQGLKGGEGTIELRHFMSIDELSGAGRLFAISVIKPHSSIGYHRHEGDLEAYYILTGRGLYNDNGDMYEVGPGDFLLCRDGESHSLTNTSDQDLEYIAAILYTKR